MDSSETSGFLLETWNLMGSNQLATLITVIATIIAIYLALPSIKEARKKRREDKAEVSRKNNTSPYITGKAVTPPQFVGRKQELKFLHDSLLKNESISLLGNRRIGKSSLLATWKNSLVHHGYTVVLINGEKQAGECMQSFIYSITQKLLPKNLSADDAANYLVQWAKTQTLETQKKPVILVDECDVIIQQCPHRFWERVRGALGEIIWLFSSKQPLDTLYRHYHNEGSPFEN